MRHLKFLVITIFMTFSSSLFADWALKKDNDLELGALNIDKQAATISAHGSTLSHLEIQGENLIYLTNQFPINGLGQFAGGEVGDTFTINISALNPQVIQQIQTTTNHHGDQTSELQSQVQQHLQQQLTPSSSGAAALVTAGGSDGGAAIALAGVQGISGDKGPEGDKGKAGLDGDKGETGETGPDGDKGATGPTGDKGLEGPAGDKGPTGDKGLVGNKGIDGIQGVQGPQGATGNKGQDGNQGETGNKGIDGDKGETGDKGPTGDQGPTGDKGPTGDQGQPGDQGPTGDKGLTGDKGSIGDKGPTGDAGKLSAGFWQTYVTPTGLTVLTYSIIDSLYKYMGWTTGSNSQQHPLNTPCDKLGQSRLFDACQTLLRTPDAHTANLILMLEHITYHHPESFNYPAVTLQRVDKDPEGNKFVDMQVSDVNSLNKDQTHQLRLVFSEGVDLYSEPVYEQASRIRILYEMLHLLPEEKRASHATLWQQNEANTFQLDQLLFAVSGFLVKLDKEQRDLLDELSTPEVKPFNEKLISALIEQYKSSDEIRTNSCKQGYVLDESRKDSILGNLLAANPRLSYWHPCTKFNPRLL